MLMRNLSASRLAVDPAAATQRMESQTRRFLSYDLSSRFQPILASGPNGFETVAYKALLRVAMGGFEVSPPEFFATLEEGERASADVFATELHVRNFLRTARAEDALVLRMEAASVRSQLFSEAELELRIAEAAKAGLDPRRMIVELDMGAELDAGEFYAFAEILHRCGVRLALTGFNADHASFNRIVQNRPEMVSFDRSWLDYGLADPRFRAMTVRVVSAVRELGPWTHFQRIEDGEELSFALSCGFTHLQGWHLARPETDCRSVTF